MDKYAVTVDLFIFTKERRTGKLDADKFTEILPKCDCK